MQLYIFHIIVSFDYITLSGCWIEIITHIYRETPSTELKELDTNLKHTELLLKS